MYSRCWSVSWCGKADEIKAICASFRFSKLVGGVPQFCRSCNQLGAVLVDKNAGPERTAVSAAIVFNSPVRSSSDLVAPVIGGFR